MAGIDNIDYSSWKNTKAIKIAEACDLDGKKGLQGEEVSSFIHSATENNIQEAEIYELLGVTVSKARQSSLSQQTNNTNPVFEKAVEYYNTVMDSNDKYNVTTKSYDKLQTRLYNMEKGIDQAFIDCEAYSDMIIVPRWHYRFYPRWDNNLINFDINEIRNRTSVDMDSLYELKDKVEYIIEEANGTTTHTKPEKTPYDIEALALKHLGMSYEEFAEKYKDDLEFFKTVTYADVAAMTSEQRLIYAKTKAYAKEMLQTTINEAHTVNWDTGDRKTEETLKATGDMYTISDFEDDGITKEGLSELKSGIMFKAFEEALIEKYRELTPTGIKETKAETNKKQPIKRIVNGSLLIFNPDGSIYDSAGKRVK